MRAVNRAGSAQVRHRPRDPAHTVPTSRGESVTGGRISKTMHGAIGPLKCIEFAATQFTIQTASLVELAPTSGRDPGPHRCGTLPRGPGQLGDPQSRDLHLEVESVEQRTGESSLVPRLHRLRAATRL